MPLKELGKLAPYPLVDGAPYGSIGAGAATVYQKHKTLQSLITLYKV